MARMIPELDVKNLALFGESNVAERDMYRELRDQLPADWVVRYNYVFCRPRKYSCSPDGQADFVVIAPNRGLMFIEVKGPAGFECINGQCYWQNDDGTPGKKVDDPFQQAQSNKHDIVEKILEKFVFAATRFPGRYGHMVAFPRARAVGALPLSHEPQVILLYVDMDKLVAKIENAFKLFGYPELEDQFTTNRMQAVVKHFEASVKLVPVQAANVDDDNRKIEALTLSQWRSYKGILGNRRVKVTGVAGSGKTMLALWSARQVAERANNPKVLFLCYNRTLADWLRASNPGCNFEIVTFHALVGQMCGKAKIHLAGDQDNQQFWDVTAPLALMDAIERLENEAKYDAVIVDEAQDFRRPWWTAVEMLLRTEKASMLHIFSDPRQNLYVKDEFNVEVDATYELNENCRNTQRIASYCGDIIGSKMESFELSPEGTTPTIWEAVPSMGQRQTVIRTVVNGWLRDGYNPGRIAILSPWSKGDSCSLTKLGPIATKPVVDGGTRGLPLWMGGQAILGDSIKSFKGLEADCVVISDLPVPRENIGFCTTDLYVAVSRAKHSLVIIPSTDDAWTQLDQWAALQRLNI